MDIGERNGDVQPPEAEEHSQRIRQDDQPNPPARAESDAAEAPQEQSVERDEASRLEELQADVRNQDDLERDITRQADQLLVEQADERDSRRLERTSREKE